MDVIVLAAIAGAGFAVASLLGLAGVVVSEAMRSLSISIAAAILLALSVAELFPEALEAAGHERAAVGFLVGFVLLYGIEILTKGHTHHHGESHLHHHALWPFVIGLGVHNLADGFAIGTSTELSHEAASAVTVGVLIHQLPVGISFAAVLAATSVSRRFLTSSALTLGLAIPVGGAIVLALPILSEQDVGVMAAAAAGALAYIAAGHLLPEAHEERIYKGAALMFPVTLAVTAYLFLSVLGHN